MNPFIAWVNEKDATGELRQIYDDWFARNPQRTEVPTAGFPPRRDRLLRPRSIFGWAFGPSDQGTDRHLGVGVEQVPLLSRRACAVPAVAGRGIRRGRISPSWRVRWAAPGERGPGTLGVCRTTDVASQRDAPRGHRPAAVLWMERSSNC